MLSQSTVVICAGVDRAHRMSLRVSSDVDRAREMSTPVTICDDVCDSQKTSDTCDTSRREKLHNLTMVCWLLRHQLLCVNYDSLLAFSGIVPL